MQDLKSDLADASFQIRVSRKSLATVAKYFTDTGHAITSKSELGRMSIEHLKDILVLNGKTKLFTDSVEATRFLNSIGLTSMNVRGREKAYQEQMQKEQGLEDVMFPSDEIGRPTTATDKLSEVERDRIDALVDQFEGDVDDDIRDS